MFQRLDGVREANRCLWVALTPFILQKSRMRKRARTDLCGGRSAMIVPTATKWRCQCSCRMVADSGSNPQAGFWPMTNAADQATIFRDSRSGTLVS